MRANEKTETTNKETAWLESRESTRESAIQLHCTLDALDLTLLNHDANNVISYCERKRGEIEQIVHVSPGVLTSPRDDN